MTNTTVPRLEIIRPSSISHTTEQVVARISDLITQAKLKPGDRLPPERELAKQLGLSRPSLRAGLRSLISIGMLKARQGAGTFVMGGPPVLDSEPLRLLASLHGFSFDHMFETRSILEVGAAGLAADHATGDQLATMAEEVSEMFATLNDPQQFLIHDICFHRAVATASCNPTLATLVEMVSTVMYEKRRDTIDRAHDFSEALHFHRRIYRAIRERDPEAAREAMRAHILEAQKAFALEEKEQAANRATRTRANA
jgi:GntR family transcriptional regulator, transcriptional repressor for pyruvate dehydrogenase complex